MSRFRDDDTDDSHSEGETEQASTRTPMMDVTSTKAEENTPSSSSYSTRALSDDDFLARFPKVEIAGTSKPKGKLQKAPRPRSIAEYAIEDTLLPCLDRGRASPEVFKKPYSTPKTASKRTAKSTTAPTKRKRSQSTSDLGDLALSTKKVKLELNLDEDEDDMNEFDDDDELDNNTIIEDEAEGSRDTGVIENAEVDMPFPDLVKDINFDVQAMLRQRDRHGDLGDKALMTWLRDSSLAMSAIEELYNSMENAPKDDSTVGADPEGLAVPLMPHQRQALKWLQWREQQKPSGGILADDMGLGKTLQMISLVLAAKNKKKAQLLAANPNYFEDTDDFDDAENWSSSDINKKYEGRTLVICPASLMNQWEREIRRRVRPGNLSTYIYHGKQKMISERKLALYDVVISTYQTVTREFKYHEVQTGSDKDSRIYKIHWDRVILDEAHCIRNHTTEMSKAICQLKGASRWVLTGTPIQNRQEDFYALLKFLKCRPFDEITIWRRFIDNKQALGNKRLRVICQGLMLRRTKEDLVAKNIIKGLPEKTVKIIDVKLDDAERIVYQKLLLYSQGFFYEFLRRREEKQANDCFGRSYSRRSLLAQEVPERLTRVMKALMRHHDRSMNCNFILVLITRLRQICCHPALIKAMLDRDDLDLDDADDGSLFHRMSSTVLDMVSRIVDKEDEDAVSGDDDDSGSDSENAMSIDATTARNLMSAQNPVFSDYRVGSKVRAVLKLVDRIIDMGEKVVVVSQWTSFLAVIARNLTKMKGAKFATFSGRTNVRDRQMMVDRLNDPDNDLNVLLLSLTAGAVGLNLVGANHLLLIDLHWNPQLENQAMDRIHRFGQVNNVHIYKLICKDTIEENIKHLQDHKLKIAESVLMGNVCNKLTIEDLKSLFSVK